MSDEVLKLIRRLSLFLAICFIALTASAQQASPAPPGSSTLNAGPETSPAFIQAADQVMEQMSKLLGLPIKEPLKKSLRSKDQIRQYLIQEDKDDKDAAQRYADDKSLEAFGLIPKGFPLDSFLLDVLTDQVAGLYDPKAKEFYIAAWIPVDEQRGVMAHELTHALEDQSFHIDPWIKAARPNDDAELARDSVSEGSAMAAMLDYSLRDQNMSVRELPDVTLVLRSGALTEMNDDPHLKDAPAIIRDELIFPYLAGTSFSQQFLKANSGWSDLKKVFENPPVSTQQIMHPDLYLAGVKPATVVLPKWKDTAPPNWKLLEENVLGEFGLNEVLKQFLGQEEADKISPAWAGDRYAVFEDDKTKNTRVVLRLQLDNEEDAGTIFTEYSSVLEHKYASRTNPFKSPDFFQFDTADGSMFLRRLGSECLIVEGATRDVYDRINSAIGWPVAPEPQSASKSQTATTINFMHPVPSYAR